MKKILARFVVMVVMATASFSVFGQYDKYNMELLSNWDDDSLTQLSVQSFNSTWGWYDSTNKREYAIVGTLDSTYFFDITDPKHPVKCDAEAGRSGLSVWRDFDVYQHYCYAVQDANKGSLQIFDLSYLPDSVHKVYDSDSLLYRTHTIFISGDKLYCNSVTTNHGTRRAAQILSLANPESPTLVGIITPPIFGGVPSFNYCHDNHVRNDTAYCSGETGGLFIFDVQNPGNPKFLAAITDYPEKGYNHSSWLSTDGKYLFFVDENLGLGIKAYDVSNFNNIEYQSVFRSHAGAVPHNPYIKGDFLYVSYYEDGVYVFDIRNPKNPTVVSFFDTYPQNNPGEYHGFNGCWAVYPFLPSGNIIAVDQTNGLFVMRPEWPLSAKQPNTEGVVNFNIYPNPINNSNFTISLMNVEEKEVTVQITNTIGVNVYTTAQTVEGGMNNIEVDLPQGLTSGIYFVSITGRISNICKKVLIR
jgi:choice-of-anchor B domain-containing protein